MVLTQTLLDDARDEVKSYILTNGTHIAVGTGTGTPASTDTALGTEVLRKAIQESSSTTSTVTLSLWLATTEANGNSLTEVGSFNAASGGTMWQRDTFTAFAKTSSKEMWVDVVFEVSATQ